jgi:hypothetical protein
MALARTRTCCCCLPVRFGVISFAILGLLGGVLVAAAGVIQIKHIRTFQSGIPTPLLCLLTIHIVYAEVGKPTLVVQVIMYILLALISIFG